MTGGSGLDGITAVAGIEVGHAHDLDALTGCTVVIYPPGAVVGVDVRGAAPATRETDLCRSGMLVDRAHAVYLGGGSAYGLAGAAGVMRALRERGIGFPAGNGLVPIVPGACLFDLSIGLPAWPDEAMGYAACGAASGDQPPQGCVGAGAGASVGTLFGMQGATKSGIGTAVVRVGRVTVGALVAVNAFGDVVSPDSGAIVAGARAPTTGGFANTTARLLDGENANAVPLTNTTIGVIATDAALTKDLVNHLATVAHDGLARTIRPVHTLYDGDTLFALATGTAGQTVPLLSLEVATVAAVEKAVLRAVANAESLGGLPKGTLSPDVPISPGEPPARLNDGSIE